jgi:short-subunit dehydrogenase
MAVPQAKVGEIAVKKTLRGKMIIVPGFIASITSGFIRILPRRWITSIYARVGN